MPSIIQLLDEFGEGMVRSQLRKIVEIYDLEWIVAHELIQNAVDAVQANPRVAEGEVRVTFDVDADVVSVRDNGKGFSHDLELLCPGGTGSEKRMASRSPAKGYQGVGLKAVMYSAVRFYLESQTTTEGWTFLAEGLNRFIDPTENHVPDYVEEVTAEGAEHTHTSIEAAFPAHTLGAFIRGLDRFLGPDAVKWKDLYREERNKRNADPFDLYLAHFLGWYFRSHSYVGDVNRLLNIAVQNPDTGDLEEVKPIRVILTLRSESRFAETGGIVGQWLSAIGEDQVEFVIPNKAWDFGEIALDNAKKAAKYRIAPAVVVLKPTDPTWNDLKVTFRDKFLDIKLRPNDRAADFRERYVDYIALCERPRSRVRAESFEDVFEKVTGIYLAVGKTSAFETLGVMNRGNRLISSNGTPTAHELVARSTSSTWYLETIQMVINVDATLNLGKRHLVSTRLVGRLNEFFEACYPTLVAISKLFVARETEPPNGDDLPEVLGGGRLFRRGIPFRRFPQDENALLAMFSSLVAVLGIPLDVYGFFSKAVYDGKFVWPPAEPRSERDLEKLEFKLVLDDLVDEFEHAVHEKEFAELGLIIVWDRRVSLPGWVVKGLSQPRRNALEARHVPTEHLEYILEDPRGDYCPLYCVPDLLQKLPLEDDAEDDLDNFVTELG